MDEELKYDKEEETSKRSESEEWEEGNERRGNVMGRYWVEMRWKRRKEERRRKMDG